MDVARLLKTYADQRARQFGISRAQWAVLVRIDRNEGLKQTELADLLDLQPITLTRLLDRLADNGLIIADNVLWSGRVVEPDGDESTQAIKAFNEHVAADDRVLSVMLTVRDGMTLVQLRSGALLK